MAPGLLTSLIAQEERPQTRPFPLDPELVAEPVDVAEVHVRAPRIAVLAVVRPHDAVVPTLFGTLRAVVPDCDNAADTRRIAVLVDRALAPDDPCPDRLRRNNAIQGADGPSGPAIDQIGAAAAGSRHHLAVGRVGLAVQCELVATGLSEARGRGQEAEGQDDARKSLDDSHRKDLQVSRRTLMGLKIQYTITM